MEETTKGKEILQWHPAFYAGIQIELKEDKENLIFENEHQLSTKPMEVDVLVIKKEKDIPVKKNIGRIFRKYNIIEYKSPTDYLSIDDFYKVYGYTCFYKSDTGGVNEIPSDELTITLVSSRYPAKLIRHLIQERDFTVSKQEDGIYYIKGDYIPIQILVTSKLSENENLWLKNLTDNMQGTESVQKLIDEYEKHVDNNLYQSVMSIIVQANKEKFQEVTTGMICEPLKEILMEQMKDELEEKMEQRLQQGFQKGIQQGIQQGMQQGIQQGMQQGIQQGMQQGMQQGIQQGIKAFIENCREFSLTYGQTTDKIVSKFALSTEEASDYMQKYW